MAAHGTVWLNFARARCDPHRDLFQCVFAHHVSNLLVTQICLHTHPGRPKSHALRRLSCEALAVVRGKPCCGGLRLDCARGPIGQTGMDHRRVSPFSSQCHVASGPDTWNALITHRADREMPNTRLSVSRFVQFRRCRAVRRALHAVSGSRCRRHAPCLSARRRVRDLPRTDGLDG